MAVEPGERERRVKNQRASGSGGKDVYKRQVLSPTNWPSTLVTVFTTPRRSASGLNWWQAFAAPALWGIVTDRPLMPRSTMAATAAWPLPAGTLSLIHI